MIRGISRQIIEVRETGNIYYESAYLVVKPEYASAERELLEKEARKILRSLDAPSGMKKARGTSFWLTRVVPPAAVAAVATVLYFAAT
ncbi:hypothetical protein [Clostridium minihomine]|uniref:hypothetical protein n=1 Tax=Clostridium minihomine TaxID=2045012 RepID=UPI000C7563F6|nr:hypothetical protein [Clostridium minihomine]